MSWKTLLLVALMAPAPAFSQSGQSAVDLYGGYSYLRQYITAGKHENAHGWNADVTAHIWKRLSVTAQFGGNYSLSGRSTSELTRNTTTYLFGPHVRLLEWKGMTFSARALAGVARQELFFDVYLPDRMRPLPSISIENAFAGAFGGTVDVRLTDRISWRVMQADALVTRISRARTEFRYSTGIVIHFGKH